MTLNLRTESFGKMLYRGASIKWTRKGFICFQFNITTSGSLVFFIICKVNSTTSVNRHLIRPPLTPNSEKTPPRRRTFRAHLGRAEVPPPLFKTTTYDPKIKKSTCKPLSHNNLFDLRPPITHCGTTLCEPVFTSDLRPQNQKNGL